MRRIQEPTGVPRRLWRATATTIGTISLTGLAIKSSGKSTFSGQGIAAAATGLGLAVVAACHWQKFYCDRQELQSLSLLLSELGEYRGLLKRNLSYLTDLSHLNGSPSDRDLSLTTTCVESLIRVVKSLHQFVSQMDNSVPIPRELVDYEPFEELGDSQSFLSEPNALKSFKSLYTIFLYIQSQFVLRVAIVLAESPDLVVKEDLQEITKALRIEVGRGELHPMRKMEIKEGSANSLKVSAFINKDKGIPGLGQLKWTSKSLSTKIMVQLNQLERIEGKLIFLNENSPPTGGTRKRLLELHEDLSSMESLFLSSACEYETLQLLLRRMLNIDEEKMTPTKTMEIENQSPNKSDLPLTIVDQSTAINIDDEFFILDGQMAEKDGIAIDCTVDESRNERVLKTSFKPVLKQLRKQLDPLNEEMLERERKFLQQQGVELPAVDAIKRSPGLYSSSTESDEELDENMVLRKKKKFMPKLSKYDENRQFLEEKVQLGLFGMPPPIQKHYVTEDVLE